MFFGFFFFLQFFVAHSQSQIGFGNLFLSKKKKNFKHDEFI